ALPIKQLPDGGDLSRGDGSPGCLRPHAAILELVDLLQLALRPAHRGLRCVALSDLREHVDEDVLRPGARCSLAVRRPVPVPLRERADLLEGIEPRIRTWPQLVFALLLRCL